MSKLRQVVKGREAWRAAARGVAQSRTRLSHGARTELNFTSYSTGEFDFVHKSSIVLFQSRFLRLPF